LIKRDGLLNPPWGDRAYLSIDSSQDSEIYFQDFE
jgi:hypothetical protein